ncbi:hypothetical protein MCELHM10_03282 [Paracoccaceae bacterium]
MTAAPQDTLRIAIVFFGITRSLRFTLDSITQNLIAPARALTADVGLFGHFYDQNRIYNPRSGENGRLDRHEYRLLPLDRVEREPPGECLADYPIEDLMRHGDFWKDNFRSFSNLVHQLHSLHRASLLAQAYQPDIVIFARPDLYYLDPVSLWLADLAQDPTPKVLVPDWAQWGGLNDRLALVRGADVIAAYGHRALVMPDYCADGRMLHSEQLLKHVLADHAVRMIPLRASRVRSDGRVVLEDFRRGRGGAGGGMSLPFDAFIAAQTAPIQTGA